MAKSKQVNQLKIYDLQIRVGDKAIVKGISLAVNPGEIHAVMGPNGSGKSTLANTLAGHPAYQVSSGQVTLNGADLLEKSPDERAQLGLFLAFQYPVEVPGVSVQNFLKKAYDARFVNEPEKLFKKVIEFRRYLQKLADQFTIDQSFLERGLNENFSGGEKKQLEILQMAVLEPEYAILDETDSGLDIDAIKKVAAGVKKVIKQHNTGVLVITHYKRILDYLKPDVVHVMIDGKIRESGDSSLVDRLEKEGYQKREE